MTWSSPHGRGVPGRDFEEARARADEVRQRADQRHGTEMGEGSRRALAFLASGLLIAAMTLAVWDLFGTVPAIGAGLLLLAGAFGLWRLWR